MLCKIQVHFRKKLYFHRVKFYLSNANADDYSSYQPFFIKLSLPLFFKNIQEFLIILSVRGAKAAASKHGFDNLI